MLTPRRARLGHAKSRTMRATQGGEVYRSNSGDGLARGGGGDR